MGRGRFYSLVPNSCREGHLNAAELAARLRDIDALASGKLRPALAIDK